jgi:hypothetical protein
MPLIINDPNTTQALSSDIVNSTPNGAAIIIGPNAHNTRVIVDRQVVNHGALPINDASVGILIQGASNVTLIGHGGYLAGFKYGVAASAPSFRTTVRGLTIRDSRASAITHVGDRLTVRDCEIEEVGGASLNVFGTEFFYGIRSMGRRPTIINNVIRNVVCPVWEAVGISSDSRGERGVIKGNSLINDELATGLTPHNLHHSWGIWVGDEPGFDEDLNITHNLLRNWQTGFGLAGNSQGILGVSNVLAGFETAANNIPDHWHPGWPGDPD